MGGGRDSKSGLPRRARQRRGTAHTLAPGTAVDKEKGVLTVVAFQKYEQAAREREVSFLGELEGLVERQDVAAILRGIATHSSHCRVAQQGCRALMTVLDKGESPAVQQHAMGDVMSLTSGGQDEGDCAGMGGSGGGREKKR